MTAVSLGIALVVSAPASAISPPAVGPAAVDSTERVESAGDIVPGVSKLFVQSAGRASAVRIRGKKYKVVMRNTDPTTLWFADRPTRSAGNQTTRSFVNEWSTNGFDADPPNAVIQFGADEGIAVELTSPRYNAKKGTLRYTAVVIEQNPVKLPKRLSNVSLFIDDAGLVYQQLTFQVSDFQLGQQLGISLSQGPGATSPVAFSSGEPFQPGSTIVLDALDNPLSIDNLDISESQILIYTVPSDQFDNVSFTLQLNLVAEQGIEGYYLRLEADPGVSVTVSTGSTLPRIVNNTETYFEWNPS